MSGVIQGLRNAVSGINRETFVQFLTQWKGRGIQLLTSLSTQMHKSSFKAFSVIVVANGLFYATVSHHVARGLNDRYNQPGQSKINRWAGIVILGAVTALFNVALSQITQFRLSRLALLTISAVVIVLRLIFKVEGSFPAPAQVPLVPENALNTAQPLPRLEDDQNYQALVRVGFAKAQILELVAAIGQSHREGTMAKFNDFVQTLQREASAADFIQNEEKRAYLLQAIINRFNFRKEHPHPDNIIPLEIFHHVLSLYKSRMVNKNYQELLASGCSQEQIDTLIKEFVDEFDEHIWQGHILTSCSKELLPLFTGTSQENSLLFNELFAEFRLAKISGVDVPTYLTLFKDVLNSYSIKTEYNDLNQAQSSSSTLSEVVQSTPQSRLLNFGFSRRYLNDFVEKVGNAPDPLEQLDAFLTEVSKQGKVLPLNYNERKALLSEIIAEFNKRKGNKPCTPDHASWLLKNQVFPWILLNKPKAKN